MSVAGGMEGSLLACCRRVVARHGLAGLYRGFAATLCGDVLGTSLGFCFYEIGGCSAWGRKRRRVGAWGWHGGVWLPGWTAGWLAGCRAPVGGLPQALPALSASWAPSPSCESPLTPALLTPFLVQATGCGRRRTAARRRRPACAA